MQTSNINNANNTNHTSIPEGISYRVDQPDHLAKKTGTVTNFHPE